MADALRWRTVFFSVGWTVSLIVNSHVRTGTWLNDRSFLSFGRMAVTMLKSQRSSPQQLLQQQRERAVSVVHTHTSRRSQKK